MNINPGDSPRSEREIHRSSQHNSLSTVAAGGGSDGDNGSTMRREGRSEQTGWMK